MSAIRTPRTTRSPRTTKSLEALSATLNRALAGARASQAAAARHADPTSGAPTPRAARTDTLAARRRTNLLIGTLERLRGPAAGARATRDRGTGTGTGTSTGTA
ncbi:hypothetical protein [Parafrankia discariae]|uniref:hypothetical protein n=1 Tax=Parafrankia discariae TaxID=365528 RepID=UPI000369A73A|nr:hypothetical protein [Parafrankia discariae]